MIAQRTRYGFATTVPLDCERAVDRTRDELAKEGFRVLTEIDVRATLKTKLDFDVRPYVVLGACNPPFALSGNDAVRPVATEVRARLERALAAVAGGVR
jgi:uncharacterized protein (DUF302 family)